MLKILKRRVNIILILVIAILLVSTISYAEIRLINLEATPNANELTSQINGNLRGYDGYTEESYDIGTNSSYYFVRKWKSNDLNYEARINITYANGLYSGNIQLYTTTLSIVPEDAPSILPLPGETDPIDNPDYWVPSENTDNFLLADMGNTIIGAIRAIGTIIAVVAIMIIGIKYMFGTIEEKANYKETMVPYLIGAIMLFTIPNLVGIIYDLVKQINF